RCSGLVRPFIIFLSNSMNSLGIQCALVGREPEPSLGVDSRGRRDRLALPGTFDDGGLALGRPGLAVHRVGSESRFIPEVDVGLALPGSRGDAWVRFALPALDGLRVALIGALQGFLRRQTQTGQHSANSGDA